MSLLLARAAVNDANIHFDRLYSYLIPAQLVGKVYPGSMVLVPFGRGNKARMAVVLAVEEAEKTDTPQRLKSLYDAAPEEARLTPDLLELVRFLKERTFCTWFEAVKAVIPYGAQYRPATVDGRPVMQSRLTRSTEKLYTLAGALPEKPKPGPRQLARAGLWLFGQCTGQCVELFGGAGQPALHDRASVHRRGPVLRPIGNDSLDGLKPGAEGALLQKANQLQKVGRQTGLLGRGIVQGFQPLGGIGLLRFLHRQHDRHPSLIAPAERHQYHAAGVNLADKLCRDEVGIQPVKMDIGVIYSRPGKQQTHSSLPCCSLNWMME